MAKETALVKFDSESYPSLMPEVRESIIAAVRDNLGDAKIRPLDLDRITVPAGGGLYWMVKSLDHPEGVPEKELSGIIVFQKRGRTYWALGFGEGGGGNTPPDCVSDDGITGVGDPGGDCAACPLSQFGKGGAPPPCSEKKMLFLLRPGSALPSVIMVPPSSLRPLSQFMLRLTSGMVPYYAIEARIGLEKAKSNDGIEFSRITFNPGPRVPPEMVAQIVEYAEAMKTVFQSAPVTAGGTD